MSITIYRGKSGSQQVREIMNLSNDHFGRVCALLGLDFHWAYQISGEALLDLQQSIDVMLDAIRHMPEFDEGTFTEEYRGEQGAIWIDCGLRPGYFREKLSILKLAVDQAVQEDGLILWC